jgi:hypothetical protein
MYADAIFTASAGKTAFTGKYGHGRTSRRTFSSKNVRYDIPGWYDLPYLGIELKVGHWLISFKVLPPFLQALSHRKVPLI